VKFSELTRNIVLSILILLVLIIIYLLADFLNFDSSSVLKNVYLPPILAVLTGFGTLAYNVLTKKEIEPSFGSTVKSALKLSITLIAVTAVILAIYLLFTR